MKYGTFRKVTLIGGGVFAALFYSSIVSDSSSLNLSNCQSYSHYFKYKDSRIDTMSVDSSLKNIAKIDKYIKPDELHAALTCAETKAAEGLELALLGDDFVADSILYQFAFSDFAYGRVYINKSHYEKYIDEAPSDGLRVVKFTFDFDKNGSVVVGDIFSYMFANNKSVFAEYKNGKMNETDRCLTCHKSAERKLLFFKSRFVRFKLDLAHTKQN